MANLIGLTGERIHFLRRLGGIGGQTMQIGRNFRRSLSAGRGDFSRLNRLHALITKGMGHLAQAALGHPQRVAEQSEVGENVTQYLTFPFFLCGSALLCLQCLAGLRQILFQSCFTTLALRQHGLQRGDLA